MAQSRCRLGNQQKNRPNWRIFSFFFQLIVWYPVYDQYLAWFGLIWGLSGCLCPTTGLDGQFHSLTLQLEKKRAIILLFFTIFDFSSIGGQFGPNWPFWTPFFLVSNSWGLPIAPLMGLSSSDILSTTRKFLPAQNSDFGPGWHTPRGGYRYELRLLRYDFTSGA